MSITDERARPAEPETPDYTPYAGSDAFGPADPFPSVPSPREGTREHIARGLRVHVEDARARGDRIRLQLTIEEGEALLAALLSASPAPEGPEALEDALAYAATKGVNPPPWMLEEAVTALRELRERVRQVEGETLPVHNHGPEEGAGLRCPEQLIGACVLRELLHQTMESDEAAAGILHPTDSEA